ncbi:MAG: cysteinyl-tRNA synthetase [Anaerolineae bacterium]|nr:MAG: cysteinyl-tRNA synthetase [Anaerolineae bacterium]
MPENTIGNLILFGSGEALPAAGKIHEAVAQALGERPEIAVLETPAGFELNSARVAGRIAEFLQRRLQNYAPQVHLVAARKRGTPHSPDAPEIVAPLLRANWIFLGPGSPTYAVRQLRDSLAWHYLTARHRLGATLMLASAATLAFSTYTLPVYEIYKVGEDLHWKPGLDFLGRYGMPLVFIPHWNNTDGGAELDTSRCFMGRGRFETLRAMLPSHLPIVGIDENTALWLDFSAGEGRVMGKGSVTLLRGQQEDRYPQGSTFPLHALGTFTPSEGGIPPEIWQQALEVHRQTQAPQVDTPPEDVLALVEARQTARAQRDWATADALREKIAALGWEVRDTPSGPQVTRRL